MTIECDYQATCLSHYSAKMTLCAIANRVGELENEKKEKEEGERTKEMGIIEESGE